MRTTRWAAWILASVMLAGPAAAANELDAPDAAQLAEEDRVRRGQAYAHLMRSLFAARRGEFRSSMGEIRRAAELQPASPEVHTEAANLLRWMGRHAEAEEMARKGLQFDPDNADTLLVLASLAAERALAARPDAKSLAEALGFYDRLAAVRELGEQELRQLANLKVVAGDFDGAIETARHLVEQRPGDRQATRTLAQLLIHGGREREALAAILDFIGKHPEEPEFVEMAEGLADELGAWELVASDLSRRPDLGATIAQGFLGEALFRTGHLGEASIALERALEGNSTDPRTRLRLVLTYRAVGRLADSSALARGLGHEYPGRADYQFLLGQTLRAQRDLDGALTAYGKAMGILTVGVGAETQAFRDRVRLAMAELYVVRRDHESARRLLGELEEPPDELSAQLQVQMAIREADWNAARQAVRRLKGAMPGEAAFLEGEIYLRTERWAKGEARLREAIVALGPFSRARVAGLYAELDRPAAGERLLREWIESDPNDANARFSLGRYLFELESIEEAEVEMRATFRLEPNHGPALNFLGYSLAERRERLDEALELIQRALSSDAFDGAYLDSLGWVYYQMGRYTEAREPLERAVREYPMDPTILEHLGDLYVKLDERELAAGAWARALAAGPTDAAALRDKMAREGLQSEAATDELSETTETTETTAADRERVPQSPLSP